MRRYWKLLGAAGLAGALAGVAAARTRRAQRTYTADEIRQRLHQRLSETAKASPTNGSTAKKSPTAP
jgi:hypothetical protein